MLAHKKQVSENIKYLHVQQTLASLQKNKDVLDSHETYQTFNKSQKSGSKPRDSTPKRTESVNKEHTPKRSKLE